MYVSKDIEPVTLYMKKDPIFEEKGPIPSFGITLGMSEQQIISIMKKQGLTLFEENYKETNGRIEGDFLFCGKAEVYGMEITAVKLTVSLFDVEYCYYFFDEEADFRSRLPAPDAKWYQVGELEGIYNHLRQSLKNEFGDPVDQKDWWKIDSTYYSLFNGSETDHMVFLSVF